MLDLFSRIPNRRQRVRPHTKVLPQYRSYYSQYFFHHADNNKISSGEVVRLITDLPNLQYLDVRKSIVKHRQEPLQRSGHVGDQRCCSWLFKTSLMIVSKCTYLITQLNEFTQLRSTTLSFLLLWFLKRVKFQRVIDGRQ